MVMLSKPGAKNESRMEAERKKSQALKQMRSFVKVVLVCKPIWDRACIRVSVVVLPEEYLTGTRVASKIKHCLYSFRPAGSADWDWG